MHPTFRQRLASLVRLLVGERERAPKRLRPEIAPLEGRSLLAFIPTVTATPNLLWPPNGRDVEVIVSGTFKEYTIVGTGTKAHQVFESLPGPKQADYQVVDEYRRDQPRGPVQLVDQGGGNFTFSFPVFLQASRSTEYAAGRRYYITVGAKDSDSWAGLTVPVQVPISPNNRGPGPLVPPDIVAARQAALEAYLAGGGGHHHHKKS
jgi:hypothetical protein